MTAGQGIPHRVRQAGADGVEAILLRLEAVGGRRIEGSQQE
jgi:hypothetical protein